MADKDLNPAQLHKLANNIRIAGGKPPVTKRVKSFEEGRTPSLVNIYRAKFAGHINNEEAQGLNPNYDPGRRSKKGSVVNAVGETVPKSRSQESAYKSLLKHSQFYKNKGN